MKCEYLNEEVYEPSVDRELTEEIKILDLLYKSFKEDGDVVTAEAISDVAEALAEIDSSEGMYVIDSFDYVGDVEGAYDKISSVNKSRYIPSDLRSEFIDDVAEALAKKGHGEYSNILKSINQGVNK